MVKRIVNADARERKMSFVESLLFALKEEHAERKTSADHVETGERFSFKAGDGLTRTTQRALTRNTSHAQRPTRAPFASSIFPRYRNSLPLASTRFDSL